MVKKKGASYFSILICTVLLGVFGVAEGAQKEGGLKELHRVRGGVAISWASRSAPRVRIDTPTIVAEDPKTNARLPIALKLTSHSTKQLTAVFDYQVVFGGGDRGIGGTLRVSMTLPQEGKSDLLLHETELKCDRPVRTDVTVQYRFQIRDTLAGTMVLPERNGYLRSYPLAPQRPGVGRYELGAQAARGSKCPQLGIPVVGLALGGRQLAVSIDPYCGGRIEASRDEKHTSVTVSTTYHGTVVPLTSEKRTVSLEFHQNGTDRMLRSFYHTIPEIKPGAAWIHDVHLVYYDYLSDAGEGWFKGLKYLADRIPKQHRHRVAACLHGWYDYFQQYAYDHKSGKLLKKWVAFPGTRKTPMSLESMHKRIKFAKDLGFRTLLYFADGTNSDSGAPAFRKEYVFRKKDGKTVKGWKGPDSLGQPLRMDPAVPGLRDWYKGYLKALLDEYGGEVDGLVWDETFYMPVGAISYSQKTPAYADRAMMSLVSEMTQIVQQYRKRNPDLVFLASDIGKTTYALVSHGTYQDSDMRIKDWGPGMFANYRNCLWSCNWHPVRHGGSRNRHAAEALGLPQGLSNGYGDNKGPHEMPKELFEAALQRFLKNARNNRQRTKYLVPSRADGRADFKVTPAGDSIVDAKALTIKGGFGQSINGCAFQQDALATHKQYQYVGYYDAERQVCLARRKLPAGKWEIIRFNDYKFKSNDAHNTISLGICPADGTIHLAFDHHVHPLHYRVSRKGAATRPQAVKWDASLFGAVTSELEKGKPIRITYPRFWQTPQGSLQFCYRQGGSGNGDRMLVDYDPKSGTWANTRQIDSRKGPFTDAVGTSKSRCSYPNGYDYGPKGKLHATWVWRESSQGSNHDLMYSYSEDAGKTWLNNKGQKLSGPPHVTSPGVKVVDISRKYGLMNTHGQAVDSRGRVHVVMWHCSDESLKAAGSKPGASRWGPPGARRNHHYWRDLTGRWRHTELPGVAGTRPKIFTDTEDNAYVVYTNSWSRGVFFPKGTLTIMAATSKADWKDWKTIYVVKGPFVNEILIDYYRWKRDKTLSVMVQESPKKPHEATPLRILDFTFDSPVAGKPECIRKIDLKDFGGMVARFGDLNGDGQADVVFVQSAGQKITCITAIDLNGKILWQRGKADEKHRSISSDAAIQIYDWDNDKANEVLVIEGRTLRILDGATGKVEKEAAVASNDSILIANFAGAPRPNDMVIKDRYKNIWVYDKNLKLQWTRKVNTGHFPMNVDLDGDGRDELLCGYTLFDRDGKVRWVHNELPDHNDAVDADDMDGDGKPEIAIACSRDSTLLSADGKILWRKPHKHSQHAVIGAFVPGKVGKQVVFVDRIDARTRSGKWNPDGGIVYCYDKAGKELWRTSPQGGITIASTIDGWAGVRNRSFVLLYRRYKGPPVLLDGSGKIAAEFPFPPAKAASGYRQHFAQHFDALGDAREEVFVYNPLALWVYHNAAPPPAGLPKPKRGANRRIYNATFYVGWQ